MSLWKKDGAEDNKWPGGSLTSLNKCKNQSPIFFKNKELHGKIIEMTTLIELLALYKEDSEV